MTQDTEPTATTNPIADILTWTAGRPLWQQDALRRLAIAGELTEADKAELVAFLRKENGLPVAAEPPQMVPLAAEHLGSAGSSGGVATRLLGIRAIRHVGRMAAEAHLQFSCDGLTAIYGDNGAGKSGYTRILRRAGSGRGDDPKKKIHPDVFADAPATDATATIDVEFNGAKEEFSWSVATPEHRIPGLTVFDSDATQAYVDFGNAIELLPFNIDIIQGLIEFCDEVRAAFASDGKNLAARLDQTSPKVAERTQAAAFVASLSSKTTAQQIAEKVTLGADQKARLKDLRQTVLAPQERLRTKTVLAPLLDTAAKAIAGAEAELGDEELAKTGAAHFEGTQKAQSAKDLNAHLLEGHDLPVGSPLWRAMWEAARAYAEAEAHPGHAFPHTDDDALCPLCQQALAPQARTRFRNLEDYVSATIQKQAEEATALARKRIADLDEALKGAEDALKSLPLAQEDQALAAELEIWRQAARARRTSVDGWLDGQSALAAIPATMATRLLTIAENTRKDIDSLTKGAGSPESVAQAAELQELEAWEALEEGKATLEQRARDLATSESVQACVTATNPAKITTFFNTMKDRYLTDALRQAYEREITALKLGRLKVTVAPKRDRDAARFTIDLDGRKITSCKLSEILSEGERRALSLAAFLAEQSIGGGSGCLVFDDPVSSLDHWWAQVIAERLAEEAKQRQVIVFTHDLVFYDKLCTATEGNGVLLEFHKLFRREDTRTSGHVDPTRSDWNSQKVSDRIKDIRNLINCARPLETTSPGEYVFHAKGIYGRMRDTWERLIEELLFGGVIQRFQKEVSSMRLKYYVIDPGIIVCINAGMTRTSTFSHDNSLAGTDPIPDVAAIEKDLDELEYVVATLKAHHDAVNKKKAGILLAAT